MIDEIDGIGKGLYSFINTPYGIILVRVFLVFIVGEAMRLISWELFGAIDSFAKDNYSKPFKRLSAFFGYVMNIGMSIILAVIFKNGYTEVQAIGWGIIYGCVAVILHVVWVSTLFPLIKIKLKKKYNIVIEE